MNYRASEKLDIDGFVQRFAPTLLPNGETPYNVIPDQFTVRQKEGYDDVKNKFNIGFRVKGEASGFGYQAFAINRHNPDGVFKWASAEGGTAGTPIPQTAFEISPSGVYNAQEWFSGAARSRLDGIEALATSMNFVAGGTSDPLGLVGLASVCGAERSQLGNFRIGNRAAAECILDTFFSQFPLRGHISRVYKRETVLGGGVNRVFEGEPDSLLDQLIGQAPLEMALKSRSTPAGVWCTPGDSMIQVDRFGRRVMNEKSQYNERTQVHFEWDPVRGEYKNLVLFMIYDQRTADLYPGVLPIQAKGAQPDHVISGADLPELTTKIQQRLELLSGRLGRVSLDAAFTDQLKQTVERFNGMAKSGRDSDFHRGEAPVEIAFQFYGRKKVPNDYSNMTMHPIADKGPYYAVLLGAGTLDTKGGPRINDRAQVLDPYGQLIPGLYGAGNCISSPAGQAYWAGGGTIGPALAFGRIAGMNAAKDTLKTN